MKKVIYFLFIFLIIFLNSCNCNDYYSKDDSKKLDIHTNFTIDDNLDNVSNKTANVVILYGQSNTTGISYNECLKVTNNELYNKALIGYDNVYINYNCDNFLNTSNGFVNVKLGQGYPNCFGPEIGIAEELSDDFDNVFIIKYTYSATALRNQWLKGYHYRGSLYYSSISYTKKSLDYLISKGYSINILGICWMQGESDSFSNESNYYQDEISLIKYYRADLKKYSNSIKFVDAYILNNSNYWVYYERINSHKKQVEESSNLNYLVDTISIGLTTSNEPFDNPDLAHYDSLSMIELGKGFAMYLK